jgi:hypothetical protein
MVRSIKSNLPPSFETDAEFIIGRVFARPVGAILRMRTFRVALSPHPEERALARLDG